MIELTNLEVCNNNFIKTQEKNKIELHTTIFGEFSFEELKRELEEIVDTSNISHEHLQGELLGPPIISSYKILEIEKCHYDVYYSLLLGYAGSPFRKFKSYVKILLCLDEYYI